MLLSLGTVAPEWIVYPWDCLALEASVLAWALPVGTNSWPVRWCWRWLLFRVVFGMGKKKFDWGWWKHPLYIKWFLVWQVTQLDTCLPSFSAPLFMARVICAAALSCLTLWIRLLTTLRCLPSTSYNYRVRCEAS